MENVDALLGEGLVHFRPRQGLETSASTRAMIGAGVPPVAIKQIQASICNAGNPASADVGIVGASGERSVEVTASALSAPALTCGNSEGSAAMARSTRLAIKSGIAWLTPS